MGMSAGSVTRVRSNETAEATALLLEALDGDGDVVTAEAGAIAEDGANLTLLRAIGREVEIAALGVRCGVVDRGRNHRIAHGESGCDELHSSSSAEHVPGHRLGGGDAD